MCCWRRPAIFAIYCFFWVQNLLDELVAATLIYTACPRCVQLSQHYTSRYGTYVYAKIWATRQLFQALLKHESARKLTYFQYKCCISIFISLYFCLPGKYVRHSFHLSTTPSTPAQEVFTKPTWSNSPV